MDTCGLCYNSPFDPSNSSANLIEFDCESGIDKQFFINVTLVAGGEYVLVVSTSVAGATGPFFIGAYGPSSVVLTGFTPSSSRPITTTGEWLSQCIFRDKMERGEHRIAELAAVGVLDKKWMKTISYWWFYLTPLGSSLIVSSYASSLTSASSLFLRPGGSSGYYYYQAIQVNISTTGSYTFTSVSSIDTYGYLYYTPFDPSYPSANLFTSNDDSGGNGQFLLSAYLYTQYSYVLVVTTYAAYVTGSFSLRASGPSLINFVSFNPSTSIPMTTSSERANGDEFLPNKAHCFAFV